MKRKGRRGINSFFKYQLSSNAEAQSHQSLWACQGQAFSVALEMVSSEMVREGQEPAADVGFPTIPLFPLSPGLSNSHQVRRDAARWGSPYL